MKISIAKGVGCVGAFLDLRKAYGMVDRNTWYKILGEEEIDEKWIQLLRDMYIRREKSWLRVRGRVSKPSLVQCS